jgi:hypothetical protein
VMSQPGGAGAHGDHAGRVTGGVVEIAGDPGALLGDGEADATFQRWPSGSLKYPKYPH